jgi:hypothetical protein
MKKRVYIPVNLYPEIHKKAKIAATQAEKPLNLFVAECIEQYLVEQGDSTHGEPTKEQIK